MRPTLLVSLLAVAACSAPPHAPRVFPETVYLGVDDSATHYSAPIAIGGASPMAISVSNQAVATAAAGDHEVDVDAVGAGSTTLIVRNDFGMASASVTITKYSASQRLAAKQEWNALNCAGCHDFGSDITPSGIARRTDAQIAAAIASGVNPDGGQIGQHSFANQASDPSLAGMVALLRSLPARAVPTMPQ